LFYTILLIRTTSTNKIRKISRAYPRTILISASALPLYLSGCFFILLELIHPRRHPVSRRLISAKDKDPRNGKPAIDKINPAIPTGSDFLFTLFFGTESLLPYLTDEIFDFGSDLMTPSATLHSLYLIFVRPVQIILTLIFEPDFRKIVSHTSSCE
jgi:hypothetical protein